MVILQLSDSFFVKNVFGYCKSGFFVVLLIGGYDIIVFVVFGLIGGLIFVIYGLMFEVYFKQWSDEFQLNYDLELLIVMVGGIYFDIDMENGVFDGLVGIGGIFINFFFGGVILGG